jgi:TRAP transporter TAXI family solute receptor
MIRSAALAILVTMALAAAPQGVAAPRYKLTLATATSGGGFEFYGAAVAAAVIGADPALDIELRNTKGSVENIGLLERGEVDLALVQGEAAYEAFNRPGKKGPQLKIVAAMYSTPGFFAVRADSKFRTIEDLRGRTVAFGAKGSGLVILARYILSGMGLDRDVDFHPLYLEDAGEGATLVLDDKAAALWGGGAGWPNFVQIAQSEQGARFIAPNERERARILKKYPFLREMSVAPGSYPGQREAITSVGSWSFIMARSSLSAAAVYRFVKALHEKETDLAAALPQGRETKASNTVKTVPSESLLHPGAIRYLTEIGLIRR